VKLINQWVNKVLYTGGVPIPTETGANFTKFECTDAWIRDPYPISPHSQRGSTPYLSNVGETCTLSCDFGYYGFENGTLTCESSGKFSPSPKCCSPPDLAGVPVRIFNQVVYIGKAFILGSKVQVKNASRQKEWTKGQKEWIQTNWTKGVVTSVNPLLVQADGDVASYQWDDTRYEGYDYIS
jgi:hypothetical protein